VKRFIAAALISLIVAEIPSCGESKGGGSGDLGHPNVSGRPGIPSPKKNQREYPPAKPTKDSQERVVRFLVNWIPARKVTITYSIYDGATARGNMMVIGLGNWQQSEIARSGESAHLSVENHGMGGETTCIIYVDGKILVPRKGIDPWNPVMVRRDAGDCVAGVMIP